MVEVAPDQLVEQLLLRRPQQVAADALGQQAGVGPRIGPGEDVVGSNVGADADRVEAYGRSSTRICRRRPPSLLLLTRPDRCAGIPAAEIHDQRYSHAATRALIPSLGWRTRHPMHLGRHLKAPLRSSANQPASHAALAACCERSA